MLMVTGYGRGHRDRRWPPAGEPIIIMGQTSLNMAGYRYPFRRRRLSLSLSPRPPRPPRPPTGPELDVTESQSLFFSSSLSSQIINGLVLEFL